MERVELTKYEFEIQKEVESFLIENLKGEVRWFRIRQLFENRDESILKETSGFFIYQVSNAIAKVIFIQHNAPRKVETFRRPPCWKNSTI